MGSQPRSTSRLIQLIRCFRLDVKAFGTRVELSRFPGTCWRFQSVTDRHLKSTHFWWGAWELNIYSLAPKGPMGTDA